jgi:hypothetical protein
MRSMVEGYVQSGAAYDLLCPSTTLRVVPLSRWGRIVQVRNRSPAALCDPRQRPEPSHAGKPNGFALWTHRIRAINKCKINRQLNATVKISRFRSQFSDVFQIHRPFLSHLSTAADDNLP